MSDRPSPTAATQEMRAARLTDPPDRESLEMLPDGSLLLHTPPVAGEETITIRKSTLEMIFEHQQQNAAKLDALAPLPFLIENQSRQIKALQEKNAFFASAMTAHMNEGKEPPHELHGRYLLLVEDSRELENVQGRLWSEAGADLTLQPTYMGAMGWVETQCRRLDGAVIDVNLQGAPEGGLAIAKLVAKRWPHAAVVLTTGFTMRDYAAQADEIGVPLVEKPYSQTQIIRALTDQWGGR